MDGRAPLSCFRWDAGGDLQALCGLVATLLMQGNEIGGAVRLDAGLSLQGTAASRARSCSVRYCKSLVILRFVNVLHTC